MSNDASRGSGPRPCELGLERLSRVQPDAHLPSRRALGHDELGAVVEGDAQHRGARTLGPGLDEREPAVRHQMHDERRPVIHLEEHPLGATARVQEAMPDQARERRVMRLADREVHKHGRADRGAGDQGIERLRERLQLGQLRHLAAVSGELPHAVRATCNGGPLLGPIFAQLSVLRNTFRRIPERFLACLWPLMFLLAFFLDQGSTLGTIAHHTTAQMSRGGRLRERGFAEGEGNEGNVGRRRCMRAARKRGQGWRVANADSRCRAT